MIANRASCGPGFGVSTSIDNSVPLSDFDSYAQAWVEADSQKPSSAGTELACQPRVRTRGWQKKNNCYNYVTGCRTGTRAQPGQAGESPASTYDGPALVAAAERDGLRRVDSSRSLQSTDGQRVVALYVGVGAGEQNAGFHWALKHPDGRWTHKLGPRPPEPTDAEGRPIMDARGANMHYKDLRGIARNYEYFATMTVPKGVWVD